MLVCWEWLSDYLELDVSDEDLALRFAMSGLNHESTETVGTDTVIDLEVTSNRGDCLGHIGVAREAAVLLGKELKIPTPKLVESSDKVDSLVEIDNQFQTGCPEYTARVIKGVKVGPSPEWLVRRLASIGLNTVNNVVDVTNYVMMECGQPLHAFDLAQIRDNKIVIRAAEQDEEFLAIDHKTYKLDDQMVVIADGQRAVALGGVMGGVDSEVSDQTVDLLIEAARFQPLAIRRAARKLKLHSPASYRFERMPDPHGLDWASQRCCELIMQLAGGTLANGITSDGIAPQAREVISFRLPQITRILGIEIPVNESVRILRDLGCEVVEGTDTLQVTPPTWRLDLTREADLIEEVARIYGYEKIPEDVSVPLGVATPRPKDLALQRARHALSAYGIDEAMTPSVVGESLNENGNLWSNKAALSVDTPLLVGARHLRKSLLPSLLKARHTNQTQGLRNAELYEVSTIFLPGKDSTDLPNEQSTLGIVTEGNLQKVKGIVEEVISEVAGIQQVPEWKALDHSLFQAGTGQVISLDSKLLGYVGLLSTSVQKSMSLELAAAIAELSVDVLTDKLQPVRTALQVSAFPGIERDLNFVVSESLQWAELSSVCTRNGGALLQSVDYRETYRDPKKDGAGKKRTLLTLQFRSLERTLTGQEVDEAVNNIVAACAKEFDAKLLG